MDRMEFQSPVNRGKSSNRVFGRQLEEGFPLCGFNPL